MWIYSDKVINEYYKYDPESYLPAVAVSYDLVNNVGQSGGPIILKEETLSNIVGTYTQENDPKDNGV